MFGYLLYYLTLLRFSCSDLLPAQIPAEVREAPVDDVEEPQAAPPHAGMREPDQYVPITNVTRIMRRILPTHARISEDAKETIQVCVSEFIHFITTDANDRCRWQQRRTVTSDDVLSAMERLGFDDYVEPLASFLGRHRDADWGFSAPRVQHEQAGQSNLQPPHVPAILPMPPQLIPQPPPYYGSGFLMDPSLMGVGGYFGDDGSGAGSSSNAPAHHDPPADQ